MLRGSGMKASATFLLLLLAAAAGGSGKKDGEAQGPVSARHSRLYGPALDSRVVTSARYLYVQAKDAQGRNFTHSPGSDAFSVKVFVIVNGKAQMLKTELNDRGDGSFQVFFHYGLQPEKLIIEVRTKDGSFVGKGNKARVIKHPEVEQCYCPTKHSDAWKEAYTCFDHEPQIDKDFAPFPEISRGMVDDVLRILQETDKAKACFVHYVIRGNIIYAQAYGKWQGFQKFTDEVLLSLARKVRIPDVDFIFNIGDWPLAGGTAAGLPVISFCGSNETDDIVVPTYKMSLSTLFGKDLENVKDVDGKAHGVGGGWDKKVPKLVWRGRDSNERRSWFVDEVAAKNMNLIDANISKNHMNYYPTEEDRQADKLLQAGKKVDRVAFLKFWRYKYLLNIDGTVAAYRLPALLSGDSVVFKQESKWYEHFYSRLEPYVHYIPVRNDLTDTVSQVQWAKANDGKARAIALAGRELVRNHLSPENLYCYYFQVLERYAAAQTFAPTVPPGYALVSQPKGPSNCRCAKKRSLEQERKRREKKASVAEDGEANGGGAAGAGQEGGSGRVEL